MFIKLHFYTTFQFLFTQKLAGIVMNCWYDLEQGVHYSNTADDGTFDEIDDNCSLNKHKLLNILL